MHAVNYSLVRRGGSVHASIEMPIVRLKFNRLFIVALGDLSRRSFCRFGGSIRATFLATAKRLMFCLLAHCKTSCAPRVPGINVLGFPLLPVTITVKYLIFKNTSINVFYCLNIMFLYNILLYNINHYIGGTSC